jgi:fatty-acyl-CoA synthase
LISLANAPEICVASHRKEFTLSRPVRRPQPTIQRLEEDLGWTITHVYGLTETAPFITVARRGRNMRSLPISERAAIKARQGVELITSGELRVVDTEGNDVPHDGNYSG